MTIHQLTYDVREAIKQFTDDSEISDRYIIYLYNVKRSKYLRQQMNVMKKSSHLANQQSLCLDTELVSTNECGLDVNCEKILRSKQEVPDLLDLTSRSAISRIAPSDKMSKPFNFVTREKALFVANSPFPNSIYAFLHDDNHIYIVSGKDSIKLIDCITITGVFEDPLSLKNYYDCCGCTTASTCFDEATTDYPLSAHLVDLIRLEIINELLNLDKVKEDKENNSDNE